MEIRREFFNSPNFTLPRSRFYRLVIVLGVCLSCLPSCCLEGENYEKVLVRKLLEDYDTAVRPSRNISVPLNVTFGLALTQIIDVDERNQILTTNCWLNQQWIDHGLRWNPADHGGIKQIRIPADKVWRPDLLLYNNADSQYNLAILSTNVIVNSEGNLTWLSTAIFKSSCQINVEYFPFDEQNCTMKFASWTYDGFQVNLLIQTEDGDLSNYVTNGEWNLIGMKVKRNVVYYSCCPDEPYPDITYMIILRRRPLFYVFNLILPCVLISGLALLSFYMPSDSGEKVTLGITTLLSMTVFLMVIGESMPPTSEKLPLIGLYYGVTISLVSFATGLSVVTLNIHHRGMRGRELPPYMRRFIFGYLAKFLLLKLDMPKRAYLFTGAGRGDSTKQCVSRTTSGVDARGPVNSCHLNSTAATVASQKSNILGRRLADTWRIVYPDMPATPPNMIHHHHGLINCNNTSAATSVPASAAAAVDTTRFRPVVRVRGMPNTGDLSSLPLTTLSDSVGGASAAASQVPGNSFHHHQLHHRSFLHQHSTYLGSMDDTFIDFKATHHHQHHHLHHRSAFGLDDALHHTAENLIGAAAPTATSRLTGGVGVGNGTTATSTANANTTNAGGSAEGGDVVPQWQRQLLFVLYKIHDTLEKNEDRMDDHERKDILKLEWQQAALVIDRLLLWIFVVATVAATFGILYMSPHTKLFTT